MKVILGDKVSRLGIIQDYQVLIKEHISKERKNNLKNMRSTISKQDNGLYYSCIQYPGWFRRTKHRANRNRFGVFNV